MAGIDIKRFLSNFGQNYGQSANSARGAFNLQASAQNAPPPCVSTPGPSASQTSSLPPQVPQNPVPAQNIPMQSMERAVFAKDVLGFPKNVNEFVYMIQRGMTQSQFNQMFANQMSAQRNSLSQIQAQILAQLQGLEMSTTKEMANAHLMSHLQSSLKDLKILSNGMINLTDVSKLIQQNGKDGIAKLIMGMTEASKMGIDTTQLKEMAKLINASVSVASENNPQKTLKLLLMLYLPWLPLEDGVGFDLEIQQKSQDEEESDSILVITISTINYGVVKATLYLESSNSVQTLIECGEQFPKTELRTRIESDGKHYSVDNALEIQIDNSIKQTTVQKQSAQINTAQTTQINPYLLLMAHTIIKNVIDIDNNMTKGVTSHVDEGL